MKKYLLFIVFAGGLSMLVYHSVQSPEEQPYTSDLTKVCHCSTVRDMSCETLLLTADEVMDHISHGDAQGGCFERSEAGLLPVK